MVEVIAGARALSAPLKASVVTLGSFDGVHVGHQALIRRTVEQARARGVPAVGYTFHPHPATVVAPERAPRTLVGIEERARLMGTYGLDVVLVQTFDAAFAQVTADRFVTEYLVEPLSPVHVVVGFNFSYGRGRGGGVDHLRAAGARNGFGIEVVDAVSAGGEVVSSTAVRGYLAAGDIEGAARLLGRLPTLSGRVVPGDQRGRTIGFPTANLALEGTLVPAFGVYAGRVEILQADGNPASTHDAVANIGRRPTFGGGEVAAEAFLLDFAGNLYGRRLRMTLVSRLREERKFSDVGALRAQLDRDVEAARAALART